MTDHCQELKQLMEKIYHDRGFDFREYKESTLVRRLDSRMRARGVKTYADYACVLDLDSSEYNKLFDALTIKVTSFFRDEVAFKALEEVVLPLLIHRGAETQRRLSIWTAGCATGQETYSIAILLLELLGVEIEQWNVTILGTDIDLTALKRARDGIFTANEVENIRPVWLKKYFIAEKRGFCVQPVLGHLVTFETHNMVSDPPYSGLDLVVCRNVIIYFNTALQTRVLKAFHEGLKGGGFLLLGKAETPVGPSSTLFVCMDSKAKVYRKL